MYEISPLDGRYRDRVGHLSRFFSEMALMRARCQVELRWVEALDRTGIFAPLSNDERARLRQALDTFTEADFGRIKAIEAEIRHDVKACERFLIERLDLERPWLIHFGLGTEDVNNLAYSRLFDAFRIQEQIPLLDRLLESLAELAERWAAAPFPARTHGQLASPTTAGKELALFLHRLLRQREGLLRFRFRGKLNGATGNLSALAAAAPEADWPDLSRRFVEELGLEPNPATTQIEDHDAWAEYFALTARINTIVLDLDRDCWSYLSRGYLVQRPRTGEVGSSTMPHKVNPIRFENSEGNLELSNALLRAFADELPRSRMQRDLSDSTLTRNVGVALAHAHLAWSETLAGLERLDLDHERCLRELAAAPELLAEPYQVILKLAGVSEPYELLRNASQGRHLTRGDLHRLTSGLDLPPGVEARLAALDPTTYTGLAEDLCREVLLRYRRYKAVG